ncbi:hypothetical protein PUN28_004308 [Cardiocondyla obscurior]|uniref:Uncharacterized protein n=1 Tax=Cardiocondyla obscurior TaxID=286306 RepID=A0AAW2GA26_9HYME
MWRWSEKSENFIAESPTRNRGFRAYVQIQRVSRGHNVKLRVVKVTTRLACIRMCKQKERANHSCVTQPFIHTNDDN